MNDLTFSGTTSPEDQETRLASGEEVRLEVGIEAGGQIGGDLEPGGQISLELGGLWQKDVGQVLGGQQGQNEDGLVVEGQDGLESYLAAWASPTWQSAHSGELSSIWDKRDNQIKSNV